MQACTCVRNYMHMYEHMSAIVQVCIHICVHAYTQAAASVCFSAHALKPFDNAQARHVSISAIIDCQRAIATKGILFSTRHRLSLRNETL